MQKEASIVADFKENSASYLAEREEYSHAHALFVYWTESDIDSQDELEELRTLFETGFNYTTSDFQLPVDGTQTVKFNLALASLIATHGSRPDTLVIIYYAGHGDAKEGVATWSAFREESPEHGDPVLSWTDSQQLLYAAPGDVLLILDCCNAAIVKRGTKTQSRFELLAASAKHVWTPKPGPRSFTSRLTSTLKKCLRDPGKTTARELFRELLVDKKLTETPIYGDLAGNETLPTSITLQRRRDPQYFGFGPKPRSVLMLRVSLTDDPTGLRIAQWLKQSPPKDVTAVAIDAIVLKARKLQALVHEDAFPEKSMFRKLSSSAQQEILREIFGLNSVVSASSLCAEAGALQFDSEKASTCHHQLRDQIAAVTTAIETPVLLEMQGAGLEEAVENDEMKIIGTQGLLLRQQLLGLNVISEDLQIPYSSVRMHNTEHRVRLGSINDRKILVELFEYLPDINTGKPYQDTTRQVESMCGLLCRPKRASFHILPCIGYIRDDSTSHFGLLFEPPPEYDVTTLPISLSSLYTTEGYILVPLGHRVALAFALINALENFHRVGWVHKAFKPENILFWPQVLIPEGTQQGQLNVQNGRGDDASKVFRQDFLIGNLDITQPFLFGFEYARADASGTKLEEDHSMQNNLYRHPDRWSRPREKFIKAHDVYSLGIILYEIALWKDVRSSLKADPRTPQQVRDAIDRRCREQLPHQAGQLFATTIAMCLDFKEATVGMSEYEMQRYFQTKVKASFERAVGNI